MSSLLRCSVTRWRSLPALLVSPDIGGRSQFGGLRDHALAHELKRRDLPDAGDVADDGGEAELGEVGQLVQDPADVGTVLTGVEREVDGLLDVVVVAAFAVAVGAKHVELVLALR